MKLSLSTQDLFDIVLRHFNIPKHKATEVHVAINLHPIASSQAVDPDTGAKEILDLRSAYLKLIQGTLSGQLEQIDDTKMNVVLDLKANLKALKQIKEHKGECKIEPIFPSLDFLECNEEVNEGKQLIPQSQEAEQAVLGACLVGNIDAIVAATNILVPADFYRESHQIIYDAILAVYDSGNSEVDLVAVSEFLEKRKLLDSIGGRYYLGILLSHAPLCIHTEKYAKIVKAKAKDRKKITNV